MIRTSDRRHSQIGLDRLIRLDWLEHTASLVLAGNDQAAVKSVLQTALKDSFRSTNPNVRGSIDKTITILLKVWLRGRGEMESLRTAGLELLTQVPQRDHLVVHWGMLMAVYPFWSSVATQVGRLLRLQGSASLAHVQRRVRERYGERETVLRRVRYIVRSYLDWGVLQETGFQGVYNAGPHIPVEDSRLIGWLIEAALHSRTNGSAPMKEIFDSPALFPFRLKRIQAESLLAASSKLDILRHGLDENLVMLRKSL